MSSNRKLTSLDQRIWHRSLRKRQKESSSSFISSSSVVLGWGPGLQASWTIVRPLNYISSNHHHLVTNSNCFTAHTAQGFEKTEVNQGIRIPPIGSVCQIDNVEQPPFSIFIFCLFLFILFCFVLNQGPTLWLSDRLRLTCPCLRLPRAEPVLRLQECASTMHGITTSLFCFYC